MTRATDSLHAFSYQPQLIEAGSCYQYIKSNIDGSYPARVFVFIVDSEHLEVLKLEAHGIDAALVKAHMDWDTFSADRLQSWVLTPDGAQKPQASLSSSHRDQAFTITWQGRSETVRVGHYPVHVYNFDFISLNLILPHWTHPEGNVPIGVLQPNFDPDPPTMMRYEGTVDIQYLDDEPRDGTPCRKYRIGGVGLKHHEGFIWVNQQKGYIEDMEIPTPDNPDWQDFKFRLISSDRMDPGQWADFVSGEVNNLRPA